MSNPGTAGCGLAPVIVHCSISSDPFSGYMANPDG